MSLDPTSATSTLESLGLGAPAPPPAQSGVDLSQSDFLTLMMTQLQAQDPLNPMDSDEFLSQMSQFSMVSGIEQLNASFATLSESMLASQTLQASQLVGRSVVIPGGTGILDPTTGMSAAVEVPQTVADLTLEVYDPSGQLVRSMSLEGQGPGLVDFKWDGLDDSGQPLPAGPYRFGVSGSIGGETQAFETFVVAEVASVSLGAPGSQPMLDLGALGQVSIDNVREIR